MTKVSWIYNYPVQKLRLIEDNRYPNRYDNTRKSALPYTNTGIDRPQTPIEEDQYRQPASTEINDPLRKDFENLRRNLENVRQKSLMKRAANRDHFSHASKDRDHRLFTTERAENTSSSELNKSIERGRPDKWSKETENSNKLEISMAFESEVEKKMWQERLKRSSSRERVRVRNIEKQLEQERLLSTQDTSTYEYHKRSPRHRQNIDLGGDSTASSSHYRNDEKPERDTHGQISRQYNPIALSKSVY